MIYRNCKSVNPPLEPTVSQRNFPATKADVTDLITRATARATVNSLKRCTHCGEVGPVSNPCTTRDALDAKLCHGQYLLDL